VEEIVYLNGELIPGTEARIHACDYGFLFGYGLFETMRAYSGTVFRLESHIERMAKSAEKMRIPLKTADLKVAVNSTLLANQLKEARVRITVSAGEGELTPEIKTCENPTVLVTATNYIPYSQEIYRRGFRAIIASNIRNSRSIISGMKTSNYLENILSRQEAIAAGADEAVFLNESGHITEASASNLFLVKNNIVITPNIESGILPGITRSIILNLALGMGIKTDETQIELDELLNADESFLTNSLMEVMPLTDVGGNFTGNGEMGKITGLQIILMQPGRD